MSVREWRTQVKGTKWDHGVQLTQRGRLKGAPHIVPHLMNSGSGSTKVGLPSHLMLILNYILALRKKGGVHFCMHTFGGEGLPPLADRRSHARNGVVTELLRSGAQPKRSWSCSGHIWLPIAVVCIPCEEGLGMDTEKVVQRGGASLAQ